MLDPQITPPVQHYQMQGRQPFGVLRLDLIDPIISGNKWFKLKYNVLKVLEEIKRHPEVPCKLLTFGGAYSNHIHATAAAGRHFGITTIGVIRGEQPTALSPTLEDAAAYGMTLDFITREAYAEKETEDFKSWVYEQYGHVHIVPEGGANYLGINGCMDILNGVDLSGFDSIVCAMGTGSTVAGLLLSAPAHIQIFGVPVIKGGQGLWETVKKHLYYFLVDHEAVDDCMSRLTILDQYHFGGYGKFNDELLKKIAHFNSHYDLPLDRIYTIKALESLWNEQLIHRTPLFIHTGGLQGNRDIH